MREFRHRLGEFAESESPVAITKHGRTIGFYIPVRHAPAEEDLTALREAGRALDALMAERGLSEEELVTDFKKARQAKKKRGR